MRIGEVSRSYGISVDNLYYYINYGLLVPKKPKGQYDFDQQTLRDLDLILELKDMKFSLKEIHQVLSLYRISSLAGEGDTEDLKRLYEKKLCELQDDIAFTQKNIAKLEDKISELNSLRSEDDAHIGLPLRMLELLRCPVCGGAFSMEGVSMNIAELFDIDVRVDRIKELKNTPVQKGREVELKNFDIEVKDLSFAYGNNPVLNGVNFSAKQGEVTALVGPSGSGKTTMIRLLSRLYDVDRGEITIGGHSLKDIAPDCLYRQISMVFQDVTLFNGTVMENIRIGRKDASDEEVMEAARKAHCDDFIVKLPEGYQTLIGENGSKLSGGERQRLSIARAFLKDAPILLLDEISASLDVENEMAIQKSLNTLMKNKTVVIISHRMKSIENVNQIVVFEDGRVNGIGRHEELMTRSKLYRNLVEKSSLTEAYVY